MSSGGDSDVHISPTSLSPGEAAPLSTFLAFGAPTPSPPAASHVQPNGGEQEEESPRRESGDGPLGRLGTPVVKSGSFGSEANTPSVASLPMAEALAEDFSLLMEPVTARPTSSPPVENGTGGDVPALEAMLAGVEDLSRADPKCLKDLTKSLVTLLHKFSGGHQKALLEGGDDEQQKRRSSKTKKKSRSPSPSMQHLGSARNRAATPGSMGAEGGAEQRRVSLPFQAIGSITSMPQGFVPSPGARRMSLQQAYAVRRMSLTAALESQRSLPFFSPGSFPLNHSASGEQQNEVRMSDPVLMCSPSSSGSPSSVGGGRGVSATSRGGRGRNVTTRSVSYSQTASDSLAQLNQYVLLDVLGSGSQSNVYLGFDNDKEEFRAIKEIRRPLQTSDEMRQIRHEINIMKKLRHKNLVTLHEVIDDPTHNKLYLVMQYVEKGPLVEYTNGKSKNFSENTTCTPIDPSQLAYYARQICAGLSYLHVHGIAHRDVKPENILLGPDDQVYLADFGVSEVFSTANTAEQGKKHPGMHTSNHTAVSGSKDDSGVDRRTSLFSESDDTLDHTGTFADTVNTLASAGDFAESVDTFTAGTPECSPHNLESTHSPRRPPVSPSCSPGAGADLPEHSHITGTPSSADNKENSSNSLPRGHPVPTPPPSGGGSIQSQPFSRGGSQPASHKPSPNPQTQIIHAPPGPANYATAKGTPAFFAPEILQGKVEGNKAAKKALDVWALGITFYMLLHGRLPWSSQCLKEGPAADGPASVMDWDMYNRCLAGGVLVDFPLSPSGSQRNDSPSPSDPRCATDEFIRSHDSVVMLRWRAILTGMLDPNPRTRLPLNNVRKLVKALTEEEQPSDVQEFYDLSESVLGNRLRPPSMSSGGTPTSPMSPTVAMMSPAAKISAPAYPEVPATNLLSAPVTPGTQGNNKVVASRGPNGSPSDRPTAPPTPKSLGQLSSKRSPSKSPVGSAKTKPLLFGEELVVSRSPMGSRNATPLSFALASPVFTEQHPGLSKTSSVGSMLASPQLLALQFALPAPPISGSHQQQQPRQRLSLTNASPSSVAASQAQQALENQYQLEHQAHMSPHDEYQQLASNTTDPTARGQQIPNGEVAGRRRSTQAMLAAGRRRSSGGASPTLLRKRVAEARRQSLSSNDGRRQSVTSSVTSNPRRPSDTSTNILSPRPELQSGTTSPQPAIAPLINGANDQIDPQHAKN